MVHLASATLFISRSASCWVLEKRLDSLHFPYHCHEHPPLQSLLLSRWSSPYDSAYDDFNVTRNQAIRVDAVLAKLLKEGKLTKVMWWSVPPRSICMFR